MHPSFPIFQDNTEAPTSAIVETTLPMQCDTHCCLSKAYWVPNFLTLMSETNADEHCFPQI